MAIILKFEATRERETELLALAATYLFESKITGYYNSKPSRYLHKAYLISQYEGKNIGKI
jgi:hypothetical protein